MATLTIEDPVLVRLLLQRAERENKSVEAVIRELLEQQLNRAEMREALAGIFEDDVTDLSTTVRETMAEYYTGKSNGDTR